MPKIENRKSAVVQSLNVSPKGSYEGLVLESEGEVLQVNFPQEWSAIIADIAVPGSHIKVDMEPREAHGHPAHPVYNLIALSNSEHRTFSVNQPSAAGNGHFNGKVERLNYALHGEINGAILDTGDFLHVKPEGAAALKLEIGMEVKGTGMSKPMIGGHQVIEADVVNGTKLEKKPKPKKKAHH